MASETSDDLHRLAGVRLGARQRAILLAAPSCSACDHTVTSKLKLGAGQPKAARVAILRAASRLEGHGLVRLSVKLYGGAHSGVYACRTPLGDEVVQRYRRELESGRSIRWPREALAAS
jgi:hypothetical protein